jgi:isovaleryl-CoA dehydrogenase
MFDRPRRRSPTGEHCVTRQTRAHLDFDLGETADMLRRTVAEFAAAEIAPRAGALDREERFPQDLWPKLGALGLLGVTVEAEFGGAGMGYLEHVIAMEEISRASAGIGLSYATHSNLCVNQIRRNGTAEQKRRYLPRLLTGRQIGALAMSEADAGSDAVSMRLRAERCGDRFVLNGTKMWITNGLEADILVLYAKTRPAAGALGLTAFIVEKSSGGGWRVGQSIDKLGMRSSNTAELIFEDCEVPVENVLGALNGGFSLLMSGLDYERLVLAGGPLGILQACLDVVLPYVRERKQFGQPIGAFQLIQAKLADLYTSTTAARAYVYAVARAFDRGHVSRKDAAGALLFAAERAAAMASQAVQALGGNGYTTDYPAARLFRDAKLYEIGAGTAEIRRLLIGRELFDERSARSVKATAQAV